MKQLNGLKHCPGCKQTKSVKLFSKGNNTSDGYKVYCKDCCRKEYLSKQNHYCEYATDLISKLKLKAFDTISNGKKITCVGREKYNCCVVDDIEFLTIDHIDGGGNQHRRKINSNSSADTYRWVIKNPEEAQKTMQILCMNGQFKKKKLNKEQKYVRNNK